MESISHSPESNTFQKLTHWLDIQLLKIRYGVFLLKKCIRKGDFSYLRFIAKMNLALLVSRLPVRKPKSLLPFLKLGNGSERIKMLLRTYVFFRIDDDRADGEFDEGSPQQRFDYIASRLDAMRSDRWDPDRSIDSITAEVLQLARKIGIESELRKCLLMVFESLAFDAKRILEVSQTGVRSFYSRGELVENYFRLDSLGTGQAMMLIFGDKPEEKDQKTIQACVDFSDAVRISYTLRDIVEDIRAGLVNIPEEDVLALGITMDDIEELGRHGDVSRASASIREWMSSEAAKARSLMQECAWIMTSDTLSELSRAVLKNSYIDDFMRDMGKVEASLASVTPISSRSPLIAYSDGVKMLLSLFLKYRNTIDVHVLESKSFFTKCHNLFLMYLGFGKNGNKEETYGAAISGFLSAYYDWVTDGPRASLESQTVFSQVLSEISIKSSANVLIHDMLQKDISGTLSDHGLERGAISFVAILEIMGLREEYESKCDIWEVGLVLQVIDDINDYEADLESGDWNALASEKASEYIARMETVFADNGVSIFPKKQLHWFIGKMREKLKTIKL